MKKITLLILLSALIILTASKSVKKTLKLSNFHKEGPFIFLTKVHIGAGLGQMDIKYIKGGEISSQSFYNDVAIGMINQTVFEQFSRTQSCADKQHFLFKKDKFNFKQERQGMKHIKIFDLNQEQIWYFYIFSCNANLEELKHNTEEIEITFGVLNNGSHFGQNEKILPAYIFIFVVWIGLIIKFAVPMVNLISFKRPDGIKMVVYGGLILLGAAYLYRLIHLLIYYSDGAGVHAFQILYLILKNIGQAIITTMIVSISWGWSIIHLNPSQYYIIIGVVAGIINIVSLILSSLTEEHEELYHHYETSPGTIVLILRVLIFLVFLAGMIESFKNSSGKIVFFIKKLGIVGGIYLLSWPITVILVEWLLPNYMHREVITFVQEFVHICACTILCQMIAEPESAYRKVSLQQDDNPLRMGNYKNK